MKRNLAQKISELIKEYSYLQNQNYSVTETIEDEIINDFHTWANGNAQTGTFLIKGEKTSLWLSLQNWGREPEEYHLVIFPENRSGPLLEIKNVSNGYLSWKYSPAKRDGKNKERKQNFIDAFRTIEAKIKIPDSVKEIEEFLNEIFKLTNTRIESDNSVSLNSDDKMNVIIKKYIDFCTETTDWYEGYKWEAVKFFQENKEIEKINTTGFLDKLFKVQINLINNLQYATIKKSVEAFPEQTKSIFENLFNDNISLKERYKFFFEEFSKLSGILAERDETTYSKPGVAEFAFFLSCMYPDKYYLYREGYYIPFAKFVSEEHKKQNEEKYLHYLELMNDFKENYVIDNQELYEVTQNLINKYSEDKNISPALNLLDSKNMLAQSVIYIVFKYLREKKVKEKKEDTFLNIIKKYTKEELLSFYNKIDSIFYEVGIIEPSKKLVLTAKNSNELNISIGKRYVFRLSKTEGLTHYGFISSYKVRRGDYEFKSPADAFFHETNNVSAIINNLSDIFIACKKEWGRTVKAGHSDSTNIFFQKSIFDKDYRNKLFNILNDKEDMKAPLNQILFGPPGTGKTYNTINKAIGIINPEFDLNQDRDIIKKEYDRLVEEEQIVFTTFHQSMSYEDFVEGIKPSLDNDEISYHIQDGIFKNIAINASKTEKEFDFDKVYNDFVEYVIENGSIELETPTQKKTFSISINGNNNIRVIPGTEFKTPMVVTKIIIKSYLFNGEVLDWKPYTIPICELIKKKFNVNVNKVDTKKKSYVIIIDEINRGNVSSIFGELITLIEEDKRVDGKEELRIVLPYSKDETNKFGVPSNLYIIGTMNTADRSVEALDTALRRRFNFVEMMPDYKVIKDKAKLKNGILDFNNYTIDLAELLETINERIELLLDRDHLIGHSYFMEVEDEESLKQAFSKQIIPLLQEYFYGDYGKISLVLGEGFCKRQKVQNASDIFAQTEDYDTGVFDEKTIYNLTPIDNQFDIVNAIKILMKQI